MHELDSLTFVVFCAVWRIVRKRDCQVLRCYHHSFHFTDARKYFFIRLHNLCHFPAWGTLNGVWSVRFLSALQPKKKHIEYIKQPKSDSLAKVLGAYEEYYRLSFVNEQKEAFSEIEDKLACGSIVIFIRGTPTMPACRASRQMVE